MSYMSSSERVIPPLRHSSMTFPARRRYDADPFSFTKAQIGEDVQPYPAFYHPNNYSSVKAYALPRSHVPHKPYRRNNLPPDVPPEVPPQPSFYALERRTRQPNHKWSPDYSDGNYNFPESYMYHYMYVPRAGWDFSEYNIISQHGDPLVESNKGSYPDQHYEPYVSTHHNEARQIVGLREHENVKRQAFTKDSPRDYARNDQERIQTMNRDVISQPAKKTLNSSLTKSHFKREEPASHSVTPNSSNTIFAMNHEPKTDGYNTDFLVSKTTTRGKFGHSAQGQGRRPVSPCHSERRAMSAKVSVSSDRSRLSSQTYQSYAAGVLHSSRKSEKFLKLQKNFAVLGRVAEIEDKIVHDNVKMKVTDITDAGIISKYKFDTMDELNDLYHELDEAKQNREFFYDMNNTNSVHWTPSKDHGLLRKEKSLGDIKAVFDEAEHNQHKRASFRQPEDFKRELSFVKLREKYHKLDKSESIDKNTVNENEKQPEHPPGSYLKLKDIAAKKSKERALYGTNIEEPSNSYEIHVTNLKSKSKSLPNIEKLHVRSISAPFKDEADGTSLAHLRSDSYKGSFFSGLKFPDDKCLPDHVFPEKSKFAIGPSSKPIFHERQQDLHTKATTGTVPNLYHTQKIGSVIDRHSKIIAEETHVQGTTLEIKDDKVYSTSMPDIVPSGSKHQMQSVPSPTHSSGLEYMSVTTGTNKESEDKQKTFSSPDSEGNVREKINSFVQEIIRNNTSDSWNVNKAHPPVNAGIFYGTTQKQALSSQPDEAKINVVIRESKWQIGPFSTPNSNREFKSFQIRDLRPLAINNEFSHSMFSSHPLKQTSGVNLPMKTIELSKTRSSDSSKDLNQPARHQMLNEREKFPTGMESSTIPDDGNPRLKKWSKMDEMHEGHGKTAPKIDDGASTSSTDTLIIKDDHDIQVYTTSKSSLYAKASSVPEHLNRQPRSSMKHSKSHSTMPSGNKTNVVSEMKIKYEQASSNKNLKETVPHEIKSLNCDQISAIREQFKKNDSGALIGPFDKAKDSSEAKKKVPVKLRPPTIMDYDTYTAPAEILREVRQVVGGGTEGKLNEAEYKEMAVKYLDHLAEEWEETKTKKAGNRTASPSVITHSSHSVAPLHHHASPTQPSSMILSRDPSLPPPPPPYTPRHSPPSYALHQKTYHTVSLPKARRADELHVVNNEIEPKLLHEDNQHRLPGSKSDPGQLSQKHTGIGPDSQDKG